MLPYVRLSRTSIADSGRASREFLPASVHKKIFLIHDPMNLSYVSLFLIQLGYDERHVTVDTLAADFSENKQPIPALSSYDWIVDYADGKFLPC